MKSILLKLVIILTNTLNLQECSLREAKMYVSIGVAQKKVTQTYHLLW